MNYQKILKEDNTEICVNILWNNEKSPAIIICPGLNLSKSGPFFILSKVARLCNEEGMNVFQFDYYSEGDSSGNYTYTSLELIINTIEKVKKYAIELGCNNFIYVGYGIGNALSSTLNKYSDTIGLCFIAPFFDAHTKVEEIFHMALSNKRENMYLDKYIWPVITNTVQDHYWCSIIGIVSWLYYTPFNMELLHEVKDIDFIQNIRNYKGNILVISPQEEIPNDLIESNSKTFKIVNVDGICPKTKSEWEEYLEWPQKWDEIAKHVSDWIRESFEALRNNYEYSKNKQLDNEYIEFIELKQEVNRYSIEYISAGKKICGILHVPAQKSKNDFKKYPCVIYEPGLGGSRVDMSRCGPWLGDYLAEKGYILFRYDSFGSGVSEGEFYEMTWEKRLMDFENAINVLGKIDFLDINNIAIVSYSAGVKVACLAANRINEVKGCVLWSPHILENNKEQRKLKFVTNYKSKLVSPLSGLWLGYEFFSNSKKYNFLAEFETCMKPIRNITGDQMDQDINISYIKNICISDKNKEIIQYPGAHCFLYQYMNQIIIDTGEFIEKLFCDKS